MKTFINTSVALGMLFAEPAMTYPTASAGALAMHRLIPTNTQRRSRRFRRRPPTPCLTRLTRRRASAVTPTIAPDTAASTRVATRSKASRDEATGRRARPGRSHELRFDGSLTGPLEPAARARASREVAASGAVLRKRGSVIDQSAERADDALPPAARYPSPRSFRSRAQ